MPFVFISHASEDKRERIKPLVEALANEGFSLWVDRPGVGEGNLGFDDDFIKQNGIHHLRAGEEWDFQIRDALKNAGAVLVCISKALCAQRDVLVQELIVGHVQRKLVACVVDDTDFRDMPSLGLSNAALIQAHRINPPRLQEALASMRKTGGPSALSQSLQTQWGVFLRIVSDLEAVLGSSTIKPRDWEAARDELRRYPIGPIVPGRSIPVELIHAMANKYSDAESAQEFVNQSMRLVEECNVEKYSERQILLSPGELLPSRSSSPEQYWADTLIKAGLKSRRTLASFFVLPSKINHPDGNREIYKRVEAFKKFLVNPV